MACKSNTSFVYKGEISELCQYSSIYKSAHHISNGFLIYNPWIQITKKPIVPSNLPYSGYVANCKFGKAKVARRALRKKQMNMLLGISRLSWFYLCIQTIIHAIPSFQYCCKLLLDGSKPSIELQTLENFFENCLAKLADDP